MPETLANKIAAGEVVQRPASAAKELIENAVDAGAGQITVILKEAGSELIQVVDDGCGMSREDAVSCFKRHATSKIAEIEDLERILTLGFRGEALASIAAVSRVELRTKRMTDTAGTCVRIDGGEVKDVAPCATQDGTSIAVRHLFFNVPARRNFLKTPATEFKHLVETFQFLALSNPEIGFTLIHDDNEVYRLSAVGSGDFFEGLRHRIEDLFGKEHAANLIPVEETTSYLTVRGFVCEPEFNRRSRGEQFLYINGRYVRNRSLDHAVMSAYEELLPDGVFPFYALFLQLDPRHVDVNVHPTKAEVKFDDERGIYAFVKTVVKKALGTALLMPQVPPLPDPGTVGSAASRPPASFDGPPPPAERSAPIPGRNAASFSAPAPPPRPAAFTVPAGGFRPSSGREMPTPARREPPGELSERLFGPVPSSHPARPHGTEDQETGTPANDTLLWQLHDQYILTQIRSGLMIVDQNAAHERILYERALQTMQGGFGLSQQLLFPHTLDFSPGDFALLKDLLPDLRALGFDIELFSGRSVVVRGVPADIRAGDEQGVLEEILEQFKSNRERFQLRSRDNLAKSIARRSAIQPGARLSGKEMRTLIDQLFMCEMPYACPNGRPTLIKIPIEELDKRFGR